MLTRSSSLAAASWPPALQQSDNGTVHWTAKVVHFCSLISHHVCHIELQCSIHGEVILGSASRGLCLARSCWNANPTTDGDNLCTKYFVLCTTTYAFGSDQACTIWQRGLLYFVMPWRAYSHQVVQIQDSHVWDCNRTVTPKAEILPSVQQSAYPKIFFGEHGMPKCWLL